MPASTAARATGRIAHDRPRATGPSRLTHDRLRATGPYRLTPDRVRATGPYRHTLLPRAVAGVPLLAIGLAHVFVADAPMRPLVEAAGIPLAAAVSPVAVGLEIVAGLSLLLGWWARVGGLLAVPVMLGAIYAHLVIGVWPNGAESEPPLALPIAVVVGAVYVLWRGAGRWSLDRWRASARDN